MTTTASDCAAIHATIQVQKRHPFPPPFIDLPLNGVYFIFERGQNTHDGVDRIVRVGSHRGWNNLAPRLWQHITPHGRSSFRWDVGAAIIAAKLPGFEVIPQDVWDHCDTVARKRPEQNEWVKPLDRFQTQLSGYIADRFAFRILGTAGPAEALELEMACIGILAGCDHCRTGASPHLRPRKSEFLWNSQHIGSGASSLSEKQWALLKPMPATPA